jgi:hypothetical protein
MSKKGFGGLSILGGVVAAATYFLLLRPQHLQWGATDSEATTPMPGDAYIPFPRYVTNRAITINRPTAEVWPWIVQLGQGRGGFYSYDWLDNLIGLDIHSSNSILPEFQNLQVGDILPNGPDTPDEGVVVATIEAEQALVLRGTVVPGVPMRDYPIEIGRDTAIWADWTWSFYLNPVNERTTRLLSRLRCDYRGLPMALIRYFLLEPSHFVMERKMLQGIKERVER